MYLNNEEIAQAENDMDAIWEEIDSAQLATHFITKYDRYRGDEIQAMLVEVMEFQFDEFETQERFDDAVQLCDYMLVYFKDSQNDEVQERLSQVLVQTCYMLETMGDPDKEIAYFKRHIDLFSEHENLVIAAQNAEMHFFLGITYQAQKKFDHAIAVNSNIISIYGTPHYAQTDNIVEFCAKAYINLAGNYFDKNDKEKCTQTYLDMFAAFPEDHPNRPLDPVAMAYVCMAEDYIGSGEYAKCANKITQALPILQAAFDDDLQLEKYIESQLRAMLIEGQSGSRGSVIASIDDYEARKDNYKLQFEKYIISQLCLWFINDERGSFDKIIASIEKYNAEEGEWYIIWDLDGIKAKLSEKTVLEQQQIEIICKHVLGETSAQTALEALTSLSKGSE